MPFTTDVILKAPLDESGKEILWEVYEPFNFYSRRYKKNYVVPKGWKTDLASVPRLPLVYLWYGGRGNAAGVLHDHLYKEGMQLKQIKSRMEADKVFLEAMLSTEVDKKTAEAMYNAVRLHGEEHFHGKKSG